MNIKPFILMIISLLLFIRGINAKDRITGLNFASRSEVIAQNGMAATSHPLATQIALSILKRGGSAVDAAIGANAALGLMEPTGCGIGGDLFAIVWSSEHKKLFGLNASGRSPAKLSLKYFKKRGIKKIPHVGHLPVSVPGCVDGWFELHKKFGKLSMQEILKPAAEYAQRGFPLTELISYYLSRSADIYKKFPNFKETFMKERNSFKKGDIFKNPYLAQTYRKIAKYGREYFYRGPLAKKIIKFLKSRGSLMSLKDFSSHKSEWVEPVSVNYRGFDIWELPPNGQGTAVLQMLNILKTYDISSMGFGSSDYIHLFTEAKKLVFEDRAKYYSDPDFNKIPLKELLSEKYAEKRRELIDSDKSASYYDAGTPENGDTIYLTVADKNGNMVSLIQSNYRGMGSGMVPPESGFMLQDRGELFALQEGHFNKIEGGKRPFHTIIPAFITKDGNPYVSFGLMGGSMQPQGHVQIIVNLLDFKMNLQEAGDAPRIRHSGSSQPTGTIMRDGGTLFLESGFSYDTVRALLAKGHKVSFSRGGFGGYQAIKYDYKNKIYYGASESRKDGHASGY